MINVDQNYTQEKLCEYKGETYKVRDNGAILRLSREGKPKRAKDDVWTFGEKIDRGYAKFCGESVHRIVAYAFLGEPPTKQHVVDHIDTNRQNNRPENLRWLTKLENILLNPYTKAKIEYWCGSIENFLHDPTQLQGHESEDANFTWMRAVTPEEAQNTMANWEKLLSKPRPVSKYKEKAIEEWIFESNQSTSASKRQFEIKALHEVEDQIPIMNEQTHDSILNIKAAQPQEVKISKREFMTAMMEICKNECWEYEKYYKSGHWKVDLFIKSNGQQYAISVFNSISAASNYISGIEKDNVKVIGFILSPKKDFNAETPCFGIHKTEEGINVNITNQQMSLHSFIKKVMDGKLVHKTRTTITAVDMIFDSIECYFCGEPHSVFFVRYLIDENGGKHDYAKLKYEYETNAKLIFGHQANKIKIPDLQFGKDIVNDVKLYIDNHPERNIVMGEIKERKSRTMNCSYMSFGCPKCDGIVGDFYLSELEIEFAYMPDNCIMDRIPLSSPFQIPVNIWNMNE